MNKTDMLRDIAAAVAQHPGTHTIAMSEELAKMLFEDNDNGDDTQAMW